MTTVSCRLFPGLAVGKSDREKKRRWGTAQPGVVVWPRPLITALGGRGAGRCL